MRAAGTMGAWCVLKLRVDTAGSVPSPRSQPQFGQARLHGLVQRGDAVVVEAAGHGAEHGHLVRHHGERLAIALHLLGHVAQRVGGALAVELVDGDELGEVEHVDLLELARGAELGRHHVHRHVDQRHDGGVALADARGLDDDQVEAGQLGGGQHVGQRLADLAARVARGERAHVHARARLRPRVDRVHADAVAQQRAAALAARRVDRDDGDAQAVALVEAEAADQLVGERRLARAAGAGDADDRRLDRLGRRVHRGDALGAAGRGSRAP